MSMNTDIFASRPLQKNILIIVSFIIVFAGAYFFYSNTTPQALTESIEPLRTELGTVAPSDLPQDLFIGEGAPLEQSYTLDYPGQKQSTVVFGSEKTITETQDIYTNYLVSNQWMISSNSVDQNTVAFYAKKENTAINIVAVSRDGKTQVSISMLRPLN